MLTGGGFLAMYEAEDMVIAMEEELQAAWAVCKNTGQVGRE